MPTTIRELMLEKEKYQNQSNIQRDAYFRDISGKDVQNLLEEWMDYMTDMENKVKKMETPKGKQNFIKLQSKTLMYGSEKTARILAKMMQHFYKNKHQDDQLSICKGIMYMAYLCSSIKEDFTGYHIEPMDILETRITGISNGTEFYQALLKSQKIIVKEIES
ncbi:TPA: hypothetical protein ACGOY6_000901 [Streptococcus suis]